MCWIVYFGSSPKTTVLPVVGAGLLSPFRTISEACGTKAAVGSCLVAACQQVSRISDQVMAPR